MRNALSTKVANAVTHWRQFLLDHYTLILLGRIRIAFYLNNSPDTVTTKWHRLPFLLKLNGYFPTGREVFTCSCKGSVTLASAFGPVTTDMSWGQLTASSGSSKTIIPIPNWHCDEEGRDGWQLISKECIMETFHHTYIFIPSFSVYIQLTYPNSILFPKNPFSCLRQYYL